MYQEAFIGWISHFEHLLWANLEIGDALLFNINQKENKGALFLVVIWTLLFVGTMYGFIHVV